MQIVVFDLNGRQYAIKTDQVDGISKLLEVTPVPKAPEYIKGLINLRGNVMSLIDLTHLLNIPKKEEDGYKNIIIIKVDEEKLGMLVREVKEVMDLDEDSIENVGFRGEEQKGVKGVIHLGERIINFLDLEQCFSG